MSNVRYIETRAMELVPTVPDAPETSFVPAVISAEADVLGMQTHERPRAAFAERAFCHLDTIAQTVLTADPQKLDAFLLDQSSPIATLTRNNIFTYALTRAQAGNATHYTVQRTDIGSSDGGFTLVRLQEGPILLSLKEGADALDESSDDYMHALQQILEFIPLLASEYNVKLGDGKQKLTNEAFLQKLQTLHKKQHSIKAFVASKTISPVARATKSAALHTFTKQEGLGKRKLRIGRLAALVLLTPIPGHAERLHQDIPLILRPSSVELASDAVHAAFAPDPLTPDQAQKQSYYNGNVDMPGGTYVKTLGRLQPLPITANIGSYIATNAQESTQYFGNTVALQQTMSPQKLQLKGKLSPDECTNIPIPSKIQTANYGITATGPIAPNLQITASLEAVTLCNKADTTVFFDDEVVYFDSAQ